MSAAKRGPKPPGEPKHPVVERVKAYTGWKSYEEIVAGLLTLTPPLVVTRDKNRLTAYRHRAEGMPTDWLIQLAYRYGLELQWLLTEEGPQFRADRRVSELPEPLKDIIAVAEQLDGENQSLLVSLAKFLLRAATLDRAQMAGAIRALDLDERHRREQAGQAGDEGR